MNLAKYVVPEDEAARMFGTGRERAHAAGGIIGGLVAGRPTLSLHVWSDLQMSSLSDSSIQGLPTR